jgi:hypothetical protein
MLARIALHQTRLATPGLGLDGKGVALGAKGLVLVPTIDRLVAWLAIYTRDRSLVDLLPSLELRVVRSPLGTQEMTVTFAAESSDRMDRVADIARLVGAFTFTGAGRHFVQYRDAAAPFGYDATELLQTDAPLALYHERFSQAYDAERSVDLRALLLRLMPRAEPDAVDEAGPRYVVAEDGLGPALVHYLVRSRVEGEVTLLEWPPESSFDDAPVRRYLVRLPEVPARMRLLLSTTPGLVTFVPAGAGVAVEAGYRHPVQLRACPVFEEAGLALVRGGGATPWIVPRLPLFGDLRSFARLELVGGEARRVDVATATRDPAVVSVALRLVPTTSPWHEVTATWIPLDKVPLLRRLAYSLPKSTLRETRVAMTARGAFLTSPRGVEAIPLGTYFTRALGDLYTPAGLDFVPRVAPEVLQQSLGAPDDCAVFVGADGRAVAVPLEAFVALETAVLEATPWDAVAAESIASALAVEPIELTLEGVGLFPLAGTAPLPADEETRGEG